MCLYLPLIADTALGPSQQRIVGPDSATMTVLEAVTAQIAGDFAARHTRFGLAELNAELCDPLDRACVLDRIGRDMVFEDLGDVLDAFRRTDPVHPSSRPTPLDLDDQHSA